MTEIPRKILNRVRAESDVGSNSLNHTHHVPKPQQELSESVEEIIEPARQEGILKRLKGELSLIAAGVERPKA